MKRYLFALSILMILGSCSSSNSDRMESNTEYLVYISNKSDTGFNLYRNSTDGTSEVQLTDDPGWEWRPQFVSESKMIVYNSEDTAGNFKMRAINLNGQSLPFETFQLPEFTISKNRDWIAYTRESGEQTNLMVAKYSSVIDSLQITENQGYNGRPSWSNERNLLAYISDRTGSNEVYVYDPITDITKRITNNDMTEKYLSWAPDDSKLAVTMQAEGLENDIYLIDLETLQVERLTNTPINESEISWSIEGNHIAYHAKVEDADDIYTIDINSKEITRITDGQGYYGEPTWIMN